MIKEEFVKRRVARHRAEREVFRRVFDFLDDKSKEAEEAGMLDKVQAYKEVEQLLQNREEKLVADLAKILRQFEYQKSKGK